MLYYIRRRDMLAPVAHTFVDSTAAARRRKFSQRNSQGSFKESKQ